jgi:hypothetical protein
MSISIFTMVVDSFGSYAPLNQDNQQHVIHESVISWNISFPGLNTKLQFDQNIKKNKTKYNNKQNKTNHPTHQVNKK